MTTCSCPSCQIELQSMKIQPHLWYSEIVGFDFAYGRGRTRKQAEEDVMGYWNAAINGLN